MDTLESTAQAAMADAGATAFSCVVDKDPHLVAQCFVWLNCLLEIQSVAPSHIFVHHTGIASSDFAEWLAARRVNLIEIEPYDSRSPHCNKIRQLETFARRSFARVVLMDCDTAWIGGAPLPSAGPVAGKIADQAHPPEEALAAIFREAGFAEPEWVEVSFPAGPGQRRTDRNNCNGGLYVLSGEIVPRLGAAWRKWADWCLDRRSLFGDSAVHVDQVGFALALRDLGLQAELLPLEWNYPIHMSDTLPPDCTPQIVHFHRELDPHFRLPPVGLAGADQAIDALNEHIAGFLARQFVNSVFWDLRYEIAPQLGSGVGSRGDALAYKQRLLGYALAAFADKRVVDIGCGDLEVLRPLPLQHYTGFDISERAIRIARAKRPDWQFRHAPADGSGWAAGDAVLCLDVLIHQKRQDEFDRLLARLVALAGERLIVSGYDELPADASEIVAFHRPIVEALKATGAFSEIAVIGRYRGCTLVVADKRRADAPAHPNDMRPPDFNEASSLTKHPDLLRALADISRAQFGFFTRQFSRALEYPWIAQKLESLAAGGRVLDIGAGLNPLPLFLARRGALVESVDPHTLARVPPIRPDWNEWGFYDYARDHPNLRAHHVDVLGFEPDALFDVIYSVSVIEHMPRATWERVLERCRRWLRPHGRLLLTVDLIPGTSWLWNYAEGREVEPTEVHGDVAAFAAQLGLLGFKPVDAFVWQKVPQSRTDLFFIECTAP